MFNRLSDLEAGAGASRIRRPRSGPDILQLLSAGCRDRGNSRSVANGRRPWRYAPFIGVLGHDLRNPLASVDAGMRVLLKNPDTQKAPEIDCDRSKMGQLFSNLLGNAIM
jgi:hypothetical protein